MTTSLYVRLLEMGVPASVAKRMVVHSMKLRARGENLQSIGFIKNVTGVDLAGAKYLHDHVAYCVGHSTMSVDFIVDNWTF
jgi:hypothetical protein